MASLQEDPLARSVSDLSSVTTSDASFILFHDVECKLLEYRPTNSKDDTIRVLRAFLDNLPQDGKDNLLDDIRACETDEELRQHASSLVEGLLFPMRPH
jgi:hypothetical protein